MRKMGLHTHISAYFPLKENKFLFKGVSSPLSTATITFRTIPELIACSLLTAAHGYLEHEL